MGWVETEIIAFHFRAYTDFILKLVKEGYFFVYYGLYQNYSKYFK